jgi:hypothetical protein
MNKTILNEDTENIIKSFLPDIERWITLRKVYNDSFLREGLEKKTVAQLSLIQTNLIEMVKTGELSRMTYVFQTYHGMDIEKLKTRKTFSWSMTKKWMNIRGNKKEKIIKFIDRLDNIIRRNLIDCFYYPYRELNLLTLATCQLNKKFQHIYADKSLKVLLLLVSILHLCTFKTPTFKCVIYNFLIFLFCLMVSL